MNLETQKQHLTDFQHKMADTLLKKGDDYASEDRLSNFKVAGAICGVSPTRQCLALIATKVARLGVLLDAKTAKNEPIRDSVLDLANYAVLLDMLLSEEKQTITENEENNDEKRETKTRIPA